MDSQMSTKSPANKGEKEQAVTIPTTKDAGAAKPTNVLAKKDSHKILHISKLGYLQRQQEKIDQFRWSVAKEALTEANDKFIEGMVYQGDP